MIIYISDTKKQSWFRTPIEKTIKIGLNQNEDFAIGENVTNSFGCLIPVIFSNQKERTVLVLNGENGVKLNGLRPFTISVLSHKDELSYQKQKMYYSTERPVQIISYDCGNQGDADCPRCKDKLTGDAVQCPRCRLWFHESEKDERRCWSYAEKCLCGYPTDADAAWRPPPIKSKTKRREIYESTEA